MDKQYPFYSPFAFAGNTPVLASDLEGLEPTSNGYFYGEVRVAPDYTSTKKPLKHYEWNLTIPEKPKWALTSALNKTDERDAFENQDLVVLKDYKKSPVVISPKLAATSSGQFRGATFGNTRNGGTKFHDGTDVYAKSGEKIFSVKEGVVTKVECSFENGQYKENSYGNYVEIKTTLTNGGELLLKYNHLDGVSVLPGEQVYPGSVIGTAGTTGNAAHVPNPHVHIQARLNDQKTDPENYIGNFDTSDGLPK